MQPVSQLWALASVPTLAGLGSVLTETTNDRSVADCTDSRPTGRGQPAPSRIGALSEQEKS